MCVYVCVFYVCVPLCIPPTNASGLLLLHACTCMCMHGLCVLVCVHVFDECVLCMRAYMWACV